MGLSREWWISIYSFCGRNSHNCGQWNQLLLTLDGRADTVAQLSFSGVCWKRAEDGLNSFEQSEPHLAGHRTKHTRLKEHNGSAADLKRRSPIKSHYLVLQQAMAPSSWTEFDIITTLFRVRFTTARLTKWKSSSDIYSAAPYYKSSVKCCPAGRSASFIK